MRLTMILSTLISCLAANLIYAQAGSTTGASRDQIASSTQAYVKASIEFDVSTQLKFLHPEGMKQIKEAVLATLDNLDKTLKQAKATEKEKKEELSSMLEYLLEEMIGPKMTIQKIRDMKAEEFSRVFLTRQKELNFGQMTDLGMTPKLISVQPIGTLNEGTMVHSVFRAKTSMGEATSESVNVLTFKEENGRFYVLPTEQIQGIQHLLASMKPLDEMDEKPAPVKDSKDTKK